MEEYEYLENLNSEELAKIIDQMLDFEETTKALMILEEKDSQKALELGKDIIKNNDDKNPDVIDRLCRFAFIMATLGVLTVGVCPAFGVMGIVVGTIFKSKKFPLSNLNKDRIKKANFLGIVSLFLFVIDIILLVVFKSKFKA